MLKPITFSLLFALALQANASTNPDKLRRTIESKDWSQGVADCDFLPEEAGRLDRRQQSGSYYAELAALCAAVASGAGDEQAADWWWFTALAMDAKTALDLLPGFRSNGLLAQLSPPRNPVVVPVAKGSPPKVTLPTGEKVDGERVKATSPPRLPKGYRGAKVTIELIIGSDGIARQPVLVPSGTSRPNPLHVFQTFAFLRQWRFSPAKVAGQPTASAYAITISSNPAFSG